MNTGYGIHPLAWGIAQALYDMGMRDDPVEAWWRQ